MAAIEHLLCPTCSSSAWVPEYEGPVRDGVFGKYKRGTVWRCSDCYVGHLPVDVNNLDGYYRSTEYREDVGENADIEDYFSRHDMEQLEKIRFLQGTGVRDGVVADIGAAGGSFLDFVKGVAGSTIAVEPGNSYHESLKSRGHQVYGSTAEAERQWAGQVDVAICFSVIEHVANPVEFLVGIRKLLAPGGVLLISTPNHRDALLEFSGEPYKSFFYRWVHPWYFDEDSLRSAALKSGMSFDAHYVQRFGFANFSAWLREGRPTGGASVNVLGEVFEDVWKSTLENRKISDYLYGFCKAVD